MKQFYVNPVGKIISNESGFFVQIDEKYIPALKELGSFSHVNIIWWADKCDSEEFRNTLTTEQPYKNSPSAMGIFATRSPVRPNPIAVSVAQIIHTDYEKGIIQISYTDAENNTPVLDLKPYTPSIERVESFISPEWCRHWPESMEKSGEFNWEDEFNF
ncbi:SAM-dependent methyltransferase [Sebaldella sp. S0638]|uniref:SAM-dependent methyltransferase n=1 Tax=Sebaldella sp. S0638 TaxID=2957809 RepID=UPI00209CC62E|nr:SAM-dependent methyltransferase [Sebaldella sp. S0638]MCP1225630.1 SAM-dependent methyltransferase [Sebaldella sp. S0638]